MQLTLKRTDYLPEGIFGELYNNEGELLCYTLEHSYDCKAKLPIGTFTVKLEWSYKFQRDLYEFKNVPDHDEVKFHAGNKQADSDGCVLVGSKRMKEDHIILGSLDALKKLHEYLHGIKELTVVVEDKEHVV